MIPFCSSLLLCLPTVAAQTVGGGTEQLYQWDGSAPGDSLSDALAAAGDLNADGHDDVLVGVYLLDPGGIMDAGAARAYSGLDGTLLYQWDGTFVDGWFGISLAGAGDVNADGFDDVIIGSREPSPGGAPDAGSAAVFSGVDGSLLRTLPGLAIYDSFGNRLSHAGDIDGDGVDDLLVSAYRADPGGHWSAGSAYVYSGATGVALATMFQADAGGTVNWNANVPAGACGTVFLQALDLGSCATSDVSAL